MMTTEAMVRRHWQLANERLWQDFGELLASDLEYEVPQTREYIDSGPGYLEMFRTWPGDWRAEIRHLVCQDEKAVCVIDFVTEEETVTGISIFEFRAGRIARVTDYWPAPYDPPERATTRMKRRPPSAASR